MVRHKNIRAGIFDIQSRDSETGGSLAQLFCSGPFDLGDNKKIQETQYDYRNKRLDAPMFRNQMVHKTSFFSLVGVFCHLIIKMGIRNKPTVNLKEKKKGYSSRRSRVLNTVISQRLAVGGFQCRPSFVDKANLQCIDHLRPINQYSCGRLIIYRGYTLSFNQFMGRASRVPNSNKQNRQVLTH